MTRIVRCDRERLEAMLAFVSAHNPAAEHHIGYFGVTPEDIRQSVLMLNLRYDRGFRLALEGERLVGVMGVDFDREIGRAWLYGPLVIAEDWDGTAAALYADVLKAIPAGINEQELFFDAGNANGRRFAAAHDFPPLGEWAVYYITPDRLAALPAAAADEWDSRYAEQLAALHAELFPSSHLMTSAMLAEAEDGATLLALADGERLAGYFFGRYEAESGEGYVELVGVSPEFRGRGIGRRLMLAGLARLREAPGLRQVNLTVSGENAAARALYDSLGFTMEREMVAFRKRVEPE